MILSCQTYLFGLAQDVRQPDADQRFWNLVVLLLHRFAPCWPFRRHVSNAASLGVGVVATCAISPASCRAFWILKQLRRARQFLHDGGAASQIQRRVERVGMWCIPVPERLQTLVDDWYTFRRALAEIPALDELWPSNPPMQPHGGAASSRSVEIVAALPERSLKISEGPFVDDAVRQMFSVW